MQPLRLCAGAGELVLDLADADPEPRHRRLGRGGAPAGALGGELGGAQLTGLEQVRRRTLRHLLGRRRHLADREPHHHPPELQERSACELWRELGGDGEAHPPGARRGSDQRRRLGHRRETLAARLGLDHQHRLAAHLRAPAPPPSGHAHGDAASAFGHELDRLDPQGGRQVAHRPRRYGRERTTRSHLQNMTTERSGRDRVSPRMWGTRACHRPPERRRLSGYAGRADRFSERRTGAGRRRARHRRAPRRRPRPPAGPSKAPRAHAGAYTTWRPARPCIQEACNPSRRGFPTPRRLNPRLRGSILRRALRPVLPAVAQPPRHPRLQ